MAIAAQHNAGDPILSGADLSSDVKHNQCNKKHNKPNDHPHFVQTLHVVDDVPCVHYGSQNLFCCEMTCRLSYYQ
jgi:hypothetical protein